MTADWCSKRIRLETLSQERRCTPVKSHMLIIIIIIIIIIIKRRLQLGCYF